MADITLDLETLREIASFNEERGGALDAVGRAWNAMNDLRQRMDRINARVAANPAVCGAIWQGAMRGTAGETPVTPEQVALLYSLGSQWIDAVWAIQLVRRMFPTMPLPPVAEPDPPADVPIMDLPPE